MTTVKIQSIKDDTNDEVLVKFMQENSYDKILDMEDDDKKIDVTWFYQQWGMGREVGDYENWLFEVDSRYSDEVMEIKPNQLPKYILKARVKHYMRIIHTLYR